MVGRCLMRSPVLVLLLACATLPAPGSVRARISEGIAAPKADFVVMVRLYWPSEVLPSIIDGSWIVPPVVMSTQ